MTWCDIIYIMKDFTSLFFRSGDKYLKFLLVGSIMIFSKLIFLKHGLNNQSGDGMDHIVGEKCVVVERIDNYAGCGEAKVNGQIWAARGAGEDDVFEIGETLRIVAIEGVKIICRK